MKKKAELRNKVNEARNLHIKAQLLNTAGKYKESLDCLIAAADSGNAQAAFDAAYILLNGIHCEENPKKAVEYYEMAAKEMDNAKIVLANCLYHGIGVDIDKKRAMWILLQFKSNKNPAALSLLGDCYRDGVNGKDWTKARNFYYRAVTNGYQDAKLQLGYCYLDGKGGEKDLEKAFENFKQLATAEGFATPDSKLSYGLCLFYGIGCIKNEVEGQKYISLSKISDAEHYTHWDIDPLLSFGIYHIEKECYEFAIAHFDRALKKLSEEDLEYPFAVEKKIFCETMLSQKRGINLDPPPKSKKKSVLKPKAPVETKEIEQPVTSIVEAPFTQKIDEIIQPSSIGIIQLGLQHLQEKRFEQAFKCFESDIGSHAAEAWYFRGLCFIYGAGCTQNQHLGETFLVMAEEKGSVQAKAYLHKLDSGLNLFELRQIADQFGNPDQHVAICLSISEKAENPFDVFRELGSYQYSRNLLEDAATYFEKALALKPHDAETSADLESCKSVPEPYTKKRKGKHDKKALCFNRQSINFHLGRIATCSNSETFVKIANEITVSYTPHVIREALITWIFEHTEFEKDVIESVVNTVRELLIKWKDEHQQIKPSLEFVSLENERIEVKKSITPSQVEILQTPDAEERVKNITVLPVNIVQPKLVAPKRVVDKKVETGHTVATTPKVSVETTQPKQEAQELVVEKIVKPSPVLKTRVVLTDKNIPLQQDSQKSVVKKIDEVSFAKKNTPVKLLNSAVPQIAQANTMVSEKNVTKHVVKNESPFKVPSNVDISTQQILDLKTINLTAFHIGSTALVKAHNMESPLWTIKKDYIKHRAINLWSTFTTKEVLSELGYKQHGKPKRNWYLDLPGHDCKHVQLCIISKEIHNPHDLLKKARGSFTIEEIGFDENNSQIASQLALNDFNKGILRLRQGLTSKEEPLIALRAFKFKAYGIPHFDSQLQREIDFWIKNGDLPSVNSLNSVLFDLFVDRGPAFAWDFAKLLWEQEGIIAKLYNKKFYSLNEFHEYAVKNATSKKNSFSALENDPVLPSENNKVTSINNSVATTPVTKPIPSNSVTWASIVAPVMAVEDIKTEVIDIYTQHILNLKNHNTTAFHIGSSALVKAHELESPHWSIKADYIQHRAINLWATFTTNDMLSALGYKQDKPYHRNWYLKLPEHVHKQVQLCIISKEIHNRDDLLKKARGAFTIEEIGFDENNHQIACQQALNDFRAGILRLRRGFSSENNPLVVLRAFKYKAYGIPCFDNDLQREINIWIKRGNLPTNKTLSLIFFDFFVERGDSFCRDFAKLLWEQPGMIMKLYQKEFHSFDEFMEYAIQDAKARKNSLPDFEEDPAADEKTAAEKVAAEKEPIVKASTLGLFSPRRVNDHSCKITFNKTDNTATIDIYSKSPELLDKMQNESINLLQSLQSQKILHNAAINPGMAIEELTTGYKCVFTSLPEQFLNMKKCINIKGTNYHTLLAEQDDFKFKVK